MPGVKGRSGGARTGAGRKPKAPTILQISAHYEDPERFLRAVMNDSGAEAKIRVDAAKALMPFAHPKKAAVKPADAPKHPGRFAAKAPPKLVVSNR